MTFSHPERFSLFLTNLNWHQLKTIAPIALAFCIASNAHALGRTHEYIVHVVNKAGEAVPDISVTTSSVNGYDQSSASCTTSSDGRCSLKFSAFAPNRTLVSI